MKKEEVKNLLLYMNYNPLTYNSKNNIKILVLCIA